MTIIKIITDTKHIQYKKGQRKKKMKRKDKKKR